MAIVETTEESKALQTASDEYKRWPCHDEREAFRAGWIAGRDWARNQEMLAQIEAHGDRVRAEMDRQAGLRTCPHLDGCITAEQCKARRQQP